MKADMMQQKGSSHGMCCDEDVDASEERGDSALAQ